MRVYFLHIENLQTMPPQRGRRGQKRKIRKVLVINGVELTALDQPPQVRELQGEHAPRFQKSREACYEIVQVRHVGKDIVRHEQVGSMTPLRYRRSRLPPQEFDDGGNPSAFSCLGEVLRRLYPEDRDPCLAEKLQQVAVVACDLDDQGIASQPEARNGHFGVLATMSQPALGVRGEVGVFLEYLLRCFEDLELDQKAGLADVRLERIDGLHLVEVFRIQVRIRKRRTPQVGKHMLQRFAAGTTCGTTHGGVEHSFVSVRARMHERPRRFARRGTNRRSTLAQSRYRAANAI